MDSIFADGTMEGPDSDDTVGSVDADPLDSKPQHLLYLVFAL